jgi:predicted SAM-dependent methyltransferase
MKEIKLDIASGPNALPGYEGVDTINYPNVKHVMDVTREWKWKKETVDEIMSSGFFEHLTLQEAFDLLKKFYESLKWGGRCQIEVPDLEWICKFFLENPDCRYKFPKNDDRAIVWMFGMQNNEWEFHRTGWTRELLEAFFKTVGFKRVVINKQFSHSCQMLLAEGWKVDVRRKKDKGLLGEKLPNSVGR